MKDKKLTIVGVIDPVCGFKKLTKVCHTEILIVEPVKKENVENKPPKESTPEPCIPFTSQGHYVIMEENPNCCVIS